MKSRPLHNLHDLTDMLHRAEQARMREVNDRETKLRQAITALEAHQKTLLSEPAETLGAMRRIGGDILWQGWVNRNRIELNRQLALCLAQKSRMMARLRDAHGRQMAASSLLEQERAARKATASHRQLAQLDALIAGRLNGGA